MKIKRQECGAYFKGEDGRGTCNTGCQWYTPKKLCPNSVKLIKGCPTIEKLKEYYKRR